MSHWTSCEVKIEDLDILQSAAEELGFTVQRNAVANGYGNQKKRAAMVISGKGMKYDIAVSASNDGGYEFITDFWGGSVAKACGKDDQKLGQLFELYSVHKVEAQCRAKRKKFKRIVTEKKTTVRVFA